MLKSILFVYVKIYISFNREYCDAWLNTTVWYYLVFYKHLERTFLMVNTDNSFKCKYFISIHCWLFIIHCFGDPSLQPTTSFSHPFVSQGREECFLSRECGSGSHNNRSVSHTLSYVGRLGKLDCCMLSPPPSDQPAALDPGSLPPAAGRPPFLMPNENRPIRWRILWLVTHVLFVKATIVEHMRSSYQFCRCNEIEWFSSR